MSKRQHHPRRTCLGCGARDDQYNLIRLRAPSRDHLTVDRLGNGRGGYLHRAEPCWQAFIRRKSLHRAFRLEISRDAKEKLVRELKERYRE